MDQRLEQTQSSEVGVANAFKGYQEAYKFLRNLQPSISENDKRGYIQKVKASKSARYIAFRLLSLRAVGEMQTKLTPFIPELEKLLLQDSSPLELRHLESLEAVTKAVSERFAEVRTEADLKLFATAGSHLPVLYAIIRVWDQPAPFQAALTAIASALDRAAKSKKRQKPTSSNNLEIVARSLIARVPEKPLLGKAVPELLKITQALFKQSEDANRENLALQSELGRAVNENDSLRAKCDEQREANKNVELQLAAASAELKRLEAELKQETEHFETLKDHGDAERKIAVQDAIARLHAEVSRRAENIRLFADRDAPNREGILKLVQEIERLFAGAPGEQP